MKRKWTALLEGEESTAVETAIPQFESEYSVEMNEVLKALGMTDAFDSTLADFSTLGHWDEGNIFISSVLHKTYICVDEAGTKAGAATAAEIAGQAPSRRRSRKRSAWTAPLST
ncbi:MAG: hypothetical protein LUF80_02740 [Oscillospiraceae bacterium]|nr:hypothetical protein [Oscillospiraceae bacterium]